MFFNDLNGKEIQTGGDITICVAETVQQRLTQYCKATKLQLKSKLKKKKKNMGLRQPVVNKYRNRKGTNFY